MSSSGREVILGVGGGIAAYKACDLARRLQDHGFLVTVVPTPASLNFVGVATWEALSGRPVLTQVWEDVPGVAHIKLAQNADFILIAPATADLMARVAQGRADDLLTNLLLASSAPTMIVPAMHPHMWLNPSTVENVSILRSRGYIVIDPDVGRLTGSDIGPGRFPETSRILEEFHQMVGENADFLGRNILVTAGGTREPIDPVRYIGNRSSGKQGYAIAQAAAARGAKVRLIAANCNLPDIEGVVINRVETAAELEAAIDEHFDWCDVLVMCAAVADAKPVHRDTEKIKKGELTSIELELTPDLLAKATANRKSGQVIVGFAAETQDHMANAETKLREKGVDLLYVNDVAGGAIFGSDFTRGTVISKDGTVITVSEGRKETLANVLLDQVQNRLSLPNV
ncbi:MAG: bifunctional phosphopantothenoylcysteine decarboxylase/phosphopantothenate--cysteine ligase CoaBC [Candidatus Nanopelagicaceae bacterium]|nr:bifunctional phosphopantothenoylcysteine decarboxylase/phosphopantothenate--cysteine ligase CoaBC [Candidatus Nanopelagicaceae bacterium]